MALRIALYELRQLDRQRPVAGRLRGHARLPDEERRSCMTATQNQQLGYALDSKWYGMPEFPTYMREALAKLTLADVNAAMKRHLSGDNLHVVIVTKDAAGLRDVLLAGTPSTVKYDAPEAGRGRWRRTKSSARSNSTFVPTRSGSRRSTSCSHGSPTVPRRKQGRTALTVEFQPCHVRYNCHVQGRTTDRCSAP